MKRIGYITILAFLICVWVGSAQAQRKVVLDLEGAVRLAIDSSFTTQKHKAAYDVSRYNYLSWQASRKPQFMFESTPAMYEKYLTRRYLSDENIDVYRQQRSFYSQGGITVTQTMEPLGGTFYGSTQLAFLRTFGDTESSQFTTVPISVGYKQDNLFFNPLKWDKQLEPLKLTRAEKELAYGIETISEQTVEKFFNLALAQDQLRMAEEYLVACDTIYSIAERRFKIASISKADLSILELEKTNAQMSLAHARIDRQRAMKELATYLGLEPSTDIELTIPDMMEHLLVNAEEAMQHARDNNPRYIESEQFTIEARRDAEKARIEKSLNLNLDLNIGLNQVANRFSDAYKDLLPKELAAITLSMPIVDWGQRKNAYLAAKSKVETAERTQQEVARDTELDVALTVTEFNERQAIVETARQALSIAEEAYFQTMRQFIRAQASTYALTWAQSCWQTARKNQIASLKNYWMSYYHLRRLTLYDYQRQQNVR